MRRERNHRRPQLERLESLTLQSALRPALHGANHPAQVNRGHAATIAVDGTASGTFGNNKFVTPSPEAFFTISARGDLGAAGSCIVAGAYATPGYDLTRGASGSLHLVNAQGTLTLQITQVPVRGAARNSAASQGTGAETVMTFRYMVADATGTFQGDKGSGTVTVTLTPGGLPASGEAGAGDVTLQFQAGAAR
jgi:hypothetical protein